MTGSGPKKRGTNGAIWSEKDPPLQAKTRGKINCMVESSLPDKETAYPVNIPG